MTISATINLPTYCQPKFYRKATPPEEIEQTRGMHVYLLNKDLNLELLTLSNIGQEENLW